MSLIAMTCPTCGQKCRVPEREVCLGVRCPDCPDAFMEAERQTDLSLLETGTLYRRRGEAKLHGTAVAWLAIMAVFNLLAAACCLALPALPPDYKPAIPAWVCVFLAALALFAIVCIGAILFRKLWGFFGLCANFLLAPVLFLVAGMGSNAGISLVGGLFMLLLLYGVLQLGNPSSWTQLE